RLHRDPFGLSFRRLRQADFQDAIAIGCLDLVFQCALRQTDRTVQPALAEAVAVALFLNLLLALGLDRQGVAGQLDIEVLWLKAGCLGCNDDLLIGVFDVESPTGRQVGAAEWRRPAPKELIEQRVELITKATERMS